MGFGGVLPRVLWFASWGQVALLFVRDGLRCGGGRGRVGRGQGVMVGGGRCPWVLCFARWRWFALVAGRGRGGAEGRQGGRELHQETLRTGDLFFALL